MAGNLDLRVNDLRVFVPAKDFAVSKRFYSDLGFQINWQHEESLAEFEIGGCRFWLQDYYVKDWAHNFMMSIAIEDADSWHRHISRVLDTADFGVAKVRPPKDEPWGARIVYCWDPSGVLIHFSQPIAEK